MATTIQVSDKLREKLETRKTNSKESYESVIWDLLEDTMELSEQTKKDIKAARAEAARGKTKTLEQVKKELGL